MKKLFRSPIHILILYLSILAVLGSISWVSGEYQLLITQQLRNYLILILAMYIMHQTLKKLSKKPVHSRLEHAVITSLILFLLFDHYTPWWGFGLLGLITQFTQRVIRKAAGPIFNPAAAAGVTLSALGMLPIWWGTNFSPRLPITKDGVSVAVFLSCTLGLFVAYRYKKLPAAVSAFISTALGFLIMFQSIPFFLILEGTLTFFVLVMVIEPKTSPVIKNEQVMFGIGVGILVNVLLLLKFLDPYLGALLIMNGAYNLVRYWKLKKIQQSQLISSPTTTS